MFADPLVLADYASANHTFSKLKVGSPESSYRDQAATTLGGFSVALRHNSQGKPGTPEEAHRHTAAFSYFEIDGTTGELFRATYVGTLILPVRGPLVAADCDDLRTFSNNFWNNARMTQMLRSEF